ncbi:hypothetical protein GCM10010990_16820 [Croceicoccus mobilis]|uniref:Demethoxyubiquinone hydroxylase family protein n=2 Tax=Croceicoccus mobilis TaxID=1703339 RepID=A0A917DUH5_9SPHN|nr:hypothetical protein GCM10010990_16820 [Croceicoccus mobilis]
MRIVARLKSGETPGDRIMKIDHAGEHEAVSIYRAQRLVARWRAPAMLDEIEEFSAHETRHRALFARQLAIRGKARCRSYHLCGLGGTMLGLMTGLMGARAIAATTVAIESVVTAHLEAQLTAIGSTDREATAAIRDIIAEEQEHLHRSEQALGTARRLDRLMLRIVSLSTETVIWLGMRL